ncbi:unnamed protein product [Linum trigynum]|uniref:Leucine-rich repeat-containing N-terminal plant-type domain-containing protein n=1 Tax=Linum trigynum TaxID=586398 RepID=A0AAV2GQE0_9ROSI
MEAPLRDWLRRLIAVFLSVAIILLLLQVAKVNGNTDTDALMTLKIAMSYPNQCLKDWDSSLVDPCTWLRITCNSDNRVIRVDVGGCGLSGKLPSGLAGLDQVQYLNLYGNKIWESIPVGYGHGFKNLKALDLSSNSLQGIIPASLGKLPSIEFLRLEHNQLGGYIPRDLGLIPTLKLLNISFNKLCGDVPPEVAHIPGADWSNNPGIGEPCQ